MEQVAEVLVIGGGVAGTTVATELKRMVPGSHITIVAPSSVLKQVSAVRSVTTHAEEVDIDERKTEEFVAANPGIDVLQEPVLEVELNKTSGGGVVVTPSARLPFDKCCIATGARPLLCADHEAVIGIRDNESIKQLNSRLKLAKRIVVLGNGGIALELVHALTSAPTGTAPQVVWAVKDKYIGNTFFDASASAFIMPQLELLGKANTPKEEEEEDHGTSEVNQGPFIPKGGDRLRRSNPAVLGGGLGPEWQEQLELQQRDDGESIISGNPPALELGCQLETLNFANNVAEGWPLEVVLTNGQRYGCDFVVSATGVEPSTEVVGDLCRKGKNGGILVDERMRVILTEGGVATGNAQAITRDSLYACGDCCSMEWAEEGSQQWMQMRLWSQSRVGALFAAKCMSGGVDELEAGLSFELFTHVTRIFGYKVVLLGQFNGQHLGEGICNHISKRIVVGPGDVQQSVEEAPEVVSSEAESSNVDVLVRVLPGVEYIKLVLYRGRLQGAMLIGETDLEETFENLILNQTDLTDFKDDLLDPDVDIEDYFD
ncbi:unnamed protein product [Chrysoparadoxa australica]